MAPSKPSKRSKTIKPKSDQISFDLKPNAKVQITIETGDLKAGKMPVKVHVDQVESSKQKGTAVSTKAKRWMDLSSWANRLGQYNVGTWLFILAIAIYLGIRLIDLTEFPIYFFTDEAIQTQSIADLIAHEYRDTKGVFLPPYFRNGDYANLSLSVYLQWIPLLLFGKSVFVTRATSVLITLIAAVSVGLILRDVFKSKYWWAGTLFLSMTPAWYLHSRTAFETAEFTAFYAGTLCAYLFYRYKSPRYLYLVFLLASLAFYSYSPGQFIVPVTALALLISDWRYHWENRQTALKGLPLLAIFAIPYLRYRAEYPSAAFSHLYTLGSYLIEDIPLSKKITHYLSEYAVGLSPWYWYIPNTRDLPRHLMKDYGNIMIATFPFAIVGLCRVLTNLRNPANRTILISMLATPVSAALVEASITRILIFVVPVAILTTLGLEQILGWLENPAKNIATLNDKPLPINKARVLAATLLLVAGLLISSFIEYPEHRVDRIAVLAIAIIFALQISNAFEFFLYRSKVLPRLKKWKGWLIPSIIPALLTFFLLAGVNIFMLHDSLKNGPLWFREYDMGGMQYGANQIFDIIKEYKQAHPQARIIFSPNWANGTNTLAQFFVDDPMPFEIASIGDLTQKMPIDDNTVFVMIPSEYKFASSTNKLTDLRVEKIVPYPDGTPGFYFVRLRYADNVDEIFAAEKALRDVPRESIVILDGQQVKVKHSYLDAGESAEAQASAINHVFDKDLMSLAKTFEANPFVIEMTFPTPRILNGFSIMLGSAQAQITLKCYSADNTEPITYTFGRQDVTKGPELSFDFPRPAEVQILTIEMLDPTNVPPTKIHIWEIILR